MSSGTREITLPEGYEFKPYSHFTIPAELWGTVPYVVEKETEFTMPQIGMVGSGGRALPL